MKKFVSIVLSVTMLITSLSVNVFGGDVTVEENKSQREILAVEKYNELYESAVIPDSIEDSELYDIVNKLVYGELYQQGQLTDKDREMITLAVLTTLGTNTVLKTHVYSALNAGLTPVEITETVYHCTPYVGAAKSLEAIAVVNEVFEERGIPMPESQATVTEESRFDDGSAAQTKLFGNLGDTKPAEGEVRLGRSFLPDYCFGDFYTRTGLTLEQHELLTWVCIATLGGAESQLTGHTNGNKDAGKSKEYMLEVLTDMMPYIGYPRTLNALNIINSVYDADK